LPADFTLAEADKNSAQTLAAIHEECFPNYWNSEAFTDFFSVENTFALVAEIVTRDSCLVPCEEKKNTRVTSHEPLGTLPVGMIVYRIAGGQADILTLAVRPSWRRHGIADALLNEAMRHCEKLGAASLFLDVEDGNQAAIALYERRGFTHLRRRKLYYRQKDGSYTDALVMTRKFA
jgi:ribosomal protein S18 acetylase RimI-like enzyme